VNHRGYLSSSQQFDLQPKPTDPLYWDLKLALSAPNTTNTPMLDGTVMVNITGDFYRQHVDSVTWFPASGVSDLQCTWMLQNSNIVQGGTLMSIALLRYVRQTPRGG
jgi:hypothetical protein